MGRVKTVTHNILGVDTKFNLNCGVNGDFSTKWPQSILTAIEVEKTFGTLKELEKAVEAAVEKVNTQQEVFEDLIFIDTVSSRDGNESDNISWKLRLRFSAYRRYTSGKLVLYRRIKRTSHAAAFSGFNFLEKEDRKLYANYIELIGETDSHCYVLEVKKQDKGNGCYSGDLNPNFHGLKKLPFTVPNFEKLVELSEGMKKLGQNIDLLLEKAVELKTLDFKTILQIEAPAEQK